MDLRTVTSQLGLRVKSLAPCFPTSHLENLALLVIGIVYSRSVSLPKAAGAVPDKRIQVESRVERFERLLQCEQLVPLDAPGARRPEGSQKPPAWRSRRDSRVAGSDEDQRHDPPLAPPGGL